MDEIEAKLMNGYLNVLIYATAPVLCVIITNAKDCVPQESK